MTQFNLQNRKLSIKKSKNKNYWPGSHQSRHRWKEKNRSSLGIKSHNKSGKRGNKLKLLSTRNYNKNTNFCKKNIKTSNTSKNWQKETIFYKISKKQNKEEGVSKSREKTLRRKVLIE